MPIQTILCPDCGTTITVETETGQRATLHHRTGPHLVKVTPRIMPIHQPQRDPERSGGLTTLPLFPEFPDPEV